MSVRTLIALVASVACLAIAIYFVENGFLGRSQNLVVCLFLAGNVAWVAINVYGFASVRERFFDTAKTPIAAACTLVFFLLFAVHFLLFFSLLEKLVYFLL